MTPGVYLHIPFCKSRCSYCDFATDIYRDSGAVQRYVDALCWELRDAKTGTPRFADTIYFGGGTPSLLSTVQVGQILTAVRETFDISHDAEITMEMNPATVTADSLYGYRELGVNRASFGVQTFNDEHLKLLARGHDSDDALETMRLLREGGFANISLDLIAGLPGQTMEDWASNLEKAIALSPEHISLYLLEIHQGTPLAEQLRTSRRPMPDPELAAEMYEVMLDRLAASGYDQYEISNFSRPGFQSRHNTKYWRLDPVFGYGVSAHSFDGIQRFANERDTAKYVDMIDRGLPPEVMRENIDAASEAVFLGLRLESGIDLRAYERRYGSRLSERYNGDLRELEEAGLIEVSSSHIRLTARGKLFSNEVFAVFV